jgi:hypothetical protein
MKRSCSRQVKEKPLPDARDALDKGLAKPAGFAGVPSPGGCATGMSKDGPSAATDGSYSPLSMDAKVTENWSECQSVRFENRE